MTIPKQKKMVKGVQGDRLEEIADLGVPELESLKTAVLSPKKRDPKSEMSQNDIRLAAEAKEQAKIDKEAAKVAKQQAKDQRAAEQAAAKQAKLGGTATSVQPTAAPAAPAEAAAPKQKKEYTTCKIQVRMAGAKPIVNTFQAEQTIGAVFDYVRSVLPANAPPRFSLSMARPRKDYTEDADSAVTLKDSGLMPSAALNLKPL